ncbi:hypothetical protein D1007_57107 [Hordeum vulgare]|uniref:Predicted protein n=1 Tax=Hordeum vulgare subsp. vulgare TaxID=112509 RepID=F2EIM8_HORVV|nr:uncharacterized protein LOC123431489 [Hordeum vulgare subsp. vulgare]XP_044971247.1 uncharacterized protein LOC123431489 [Hordeum vulgare subsp. vulgare]KAE8771043.1 hypothetical protein D1007_57107 [Hordeum vulgare]BAK07200.1 predicted protein [Hordeum vulgare subsp. vulgare]
MAEACPDNQRCLPAWMMKPCSSNEVSKTEHRNKQAAESDNPSGALDQSKPIRRKRKIVDTEDAGGLKALQRCQGKENAGRKSKDADRAFTDEFDEIEKITCKNERKVCGRAATKNSRKRMLEDVGSDASSSGITDDEIELSAGNSRALQRCQGREKTRRKHDGADYSAKDELEEIGKTIRKNVTKVTGRAAPKNSRKQKPDNVGSETLSSGTTDDEIELTVEDLVSIAEEIINADKGKLQNVRTTKTARYEEHPPRPPVSTSADTGGSASSTWSTKGLMQCTATTTDGTPSEYSVDKNKRHEEPESLPSVKMTGDVAEDMMNILLGPLWNSEPAAHENKPKAVAPRTMNVNLEPRRKNDWQKTVEQVQGVPVAKKKSSLKDMVAFFLD